MNLKKDIVLFIATSLDGYIAREDGSIDWMDDVKGEGDNGYAQFYDTVDTVIMGNKTYEHTKILTDEFPYQDKECYVFSRTVKNKGNDVKFVNDDVDTFIHKLAVNPGNKKIWIVGGAKVLNGFLKKQLVDEFIISVIPILLGKGIPLFYKNNPELNLELTEIRQDGQIAQLHYKKKRD